MNTAPTPDWTASPLILQDFMILGHAVGAVVINLDLNSVFSALMVNMPREYQLFLANRNGDYLDTPRPNHDLWFR